MKRTEQIWYNSVNFSFAYSFSNKHVLENNLARTIFPIYKSGTKFWKVSIFIKSHFCGTCENMWLNIVIQLIPDN